jgi:hypothetical protein
MQDTRICSTRTMATPTNKNDVTTTENVGEDGAEQLEVKVHIHAKTIIAVLVSSTSHKASVC